VLESEGLRFDESGRADPYQRITADDFREQLTELGIDGAAESPSRRAWLVRGSSVDGHDLVPVWLQKGSASLAAASLREIDPPVPLVTLKTTIEQNYQHKSYAVREGKDDYLLTTSQGKMYLGQITGDTTYTLSSDRRSNLRRKVEWLNTTRAVPFSNLPQPDAPCRRPRWSRRPLPGRRHPPAHLQPPRLAQADRDRHRRPICAAKDQLSDDGGDSGVEPGAAAR
jgi:5-methylcytosine-specific restriction protein B